MPEDTETGKNVPPKTRTRRGGVGRRRGKAQSTQAKPPPKAKTTRPAPQKRQSNAASHNANSRGRRGSGTKGGARGRKPAIDPNRKATPSYLQELKSKRLITALTAYDAPTAKLACAAGVDFLLVGDSVGTAALGFDTTVPVTLDMMIHHAGAARRGGPQCLLVVDLPFAEASFPFDHLLTACRRLMQEAGADAVKLEGGRLVAENIQRLVQAGIPVMGHVGLLPQTVKAISGYRKFGKEREEAEDILTDAVALEEAGCFAIVAEMVEERLAGELAKTLEVPIIGIGSGGGCDGQILVSSDLLGLTQGQVPSFVKPQADLAGEMTQAFRSYVDDVRAGRYPGK